MTWWFLVACGIKAGGIGDTSPGTTGSSPAVDTANAPSATDTDTTTSTPCAGPPIVADDGWAVVEDGELVVDAPGVLSNDTHGCPLTAVLVDAPTNGTLTLDADGAILYRPDPDFNGDDGFTYEASGGDEVSLGVVTLQVLPANDAPVAANDSYEVRTGDTLRVPADAGVLANDSDPDGDPLTARIDPVGVPTNGTWTFLPDGSLEYTSFADFEGAERIAYKAFDGAAESNLAQATITVRR
ncbi:MAG: hypothetical protein ACI8PZ_003575 [Myxococcota bacterium]|jgi:hypothetical protein